MSVSSPEGSVTKSLTCRGGRVCTKRGLRLGEFLWGGGKRGPEQTHPWTTVSRAYIMARFHVFGGDKGKGKREGEGHNARPVGGKMGL